MSKKIILHIAYSGLGGQSNVAKNLATYGNECDDEYQHEILFCGIEELNEANRSFCEQHQLKYDALKKKEGFDPAFFYRLFRKVISIKPDVVISNLISVYPALFLSKIKLNHLLFFAEQHSIGLRDKGNLFHSKMAGMVGDSTVVLNQEAKDYFVKHKVLKEAKVMIIPNGMRIIHKTNPYLNKQDSTKMIGTVSRFVAGKDIATIIEAMKIIHDTMPDVRLTIVGEGEDEQRLHDLVAKYQLEACIHFASKLTNDELYQFYQSLDIFILSTAGEGLPTTIIEAFQFGLPVIASKVSGVTSMIEDEKNGLLFDYQDKQKLSELIISLYNGGSEILNQLSTSAFDSFHAYYSIGVSYQQYKQMIGALSHQ